jgi:hypothetical protein
MPSVAPGAPIPSEPGMTPSSELQPSLTPTPPTVTVSPQMVSRWRGARALSAAGTVTGLIGSGLTLSSILLVAITGYPCNPNDPIHMINPSDPCSAMSANYSPAKPTDAAPLLAYIGSSTSALGFVLSAAGLGYQHHLLNEMGSDIPRGVFHGGTVLGLLGFVSVGVGYFFGFTDYLDPHGQGVAILSATITGTVLCTLGSLLYAIDSGRMRKAWFRLSPSG